MALETTLGMTTMVEQPRTLIRTNQEEACDESQAPRKYQRRANYRSRLRQQWTRYTSLRETLARSWKIENFPFAPQTRYSACFPK
jgi:hypothetical protein